VDSFGFLFKSSSLFQMSLGASKCVLFFSTDLILNNCFLIRNFVITSRHSARNVLPRQPPSERKYKQFFQWFGEK